MASKNYFSAPRGFQSRTTSTPKASDPLAGWGSNAEMQNRLQKEKLANDAAASKQTEQEMVMRSVYGAAGEHPGESYDARLNEELKNPAQPETEAEANFRKKPMTYDMMKTVLTRKPATPKTPPHGPMDYTEQALAYAKSFKPGAEDANGNPISADQIMRDTMKKYKNINVKDPRWNEFNRNFTVPEKPSFMDKIASVASTAGKRIVDAGQSLIPKEASTVTRDKNPFQSKYPDAVQLADKTWATQLDGKWHRITQK